MDSCLPYKTAMVSLNTSCLNYTGNWNPFGKTNGCFLGKIEKINVKFPKIIMKGDEKWKSPSRDESGPGKADNRDLQGRLEGGGYGSISHATAHAQSGMTIDADKDKQTHDGTSVNANTERTPAGNVSTVTTTAMILDQKKEMFASAQKKLDEQGKLVASLAKLVETLTAKAKSKNPRGAMRARAGPREPAAAEDSISRLRAIGPHGQTKILQVRTLTKQSRQAHNRPRRTFHLPPGATKEAISSGSIKT
ncbi:hypothetical protein F2Q68_00010853 [Brassica cretica]|uniref:Uncharacterized protein n=1 Tax=Brassica cretica TaxID=69181 RepID=A0A8S9KQB7_BRACR|nr:hypothetical protein F2Q68_00010853 [Brassica cretica]